MRQVEARMDMIWVTEGLTTKELEPNRVLVESYQLLRTCFSSYQIAQPPFSFSLVLLQSLPRLGQE